MTTFSWNAIYCSFNPSINVGCGDDTRAHRFSHWPIEYASVLVRTEGVSLRPAPRSDARLEEDCLIRLVPAR